MRLSSSPGSQTDRVFSTLFLLCALTCVLAISTIAGYLLIEGWSAFREVGLVNFVTGHDWLPAAYFGILPMILGTLLAAFSAVAIATPIGILTAIFLTELASRPLAKMLRALFELMAAIPSLVYGFFGLVVIVPAIEQLFLVPAGQTLLAGIVVLVMMLLPTMIILAEGALRAVPRAQRLASFALGSSKVFTVVHVVLPMARHGIVVAVILSIARAFGETMAIMMVMGNSPVLVTSLLEPARTLTVNIALEMSYASGLHSSALYATGVVLLLVIIVLNLALLYLNRKRAHCR